MALSHNYVNIAFVTPKPEDISILNPPTPYNFSQPGPEADVKIGQTNKMDSGPMTTNRRDGDEDFGPGVGRVRHSLTMEETLPRRRTAFPAYVAFQKTAHTFHLIGVLIIEILRLAGIVLQVE